MRKMLENTIDVQIILPCQNVSDDKIARVQSVCATRNLIVILCS